MIFDDKAKDLLKAILMEEMMKDYPAEIRAKMERITQSIFPSAEEDAIF